MEKFAIGALLGALGGALLVANNYKMQRLVKKGQTEAIEKMDKFIDEKLDKANDKLNELGTEDGQESVQTKKKSKK